MTEPSSNGGDVEDGEEMPTDCISPTPDVFSYFMFTSPNEKLRHGYFTLDAAMSYLLVFVTLAIQWVLLFCVYRMVIGNSTEWQHGIVNTGQDWNLFAAKTAGCNTGDSLCTLENGTYTCAPPSLQLIGRWDELDTDKDGVWARHEVMNAQEDLKCKYAVDPVEVFDVLILLLKERQEHIWLHPDVRESKAIPKTYFTYIMGDVVMCGYRNEDMCGNLMKNGVFDAPLENANVPRIGDSVRSALDYCRALLEPRGLCERLLPSSYSTWKIESEQECGEAMYSKYAHEDPSEGKGAVKSMLTVDYAARQRYERAQTPIFITYKFCVVLIWVLLLVSQVREVGKTMAWIVQLKHHTETDFICEQPGNRRQQPCDTMALDDAVERMSFRHKIAMAFTTFVRIAMLFVLLFVGLQFLGRQMDYIDLLLDGVALMFIVQVEEILYLRGLRQDVRTHWESREPVQIVKVGMKGLTSRPDVVDLLWFLLVAAVSLAFLLHYTSGTVAPVYESLQCACLGEGESCRESHVYSASFWSQYWSSDVPSSIQHIQSMKTAFYSSTKGMKVTPVSLLKYHHPHAHLGFSG